MSCLPSEFSISNRQGRVRDLVRIYLKDHQPNALKEKYFFENMPSLDLTLHHAAFALDHRDPPKRYSHQRRIRFAPMRKAYKFLLGARKELLGFTTFERLHEFLSSAFSKIKGLGPLYTYDTALRIGFFLKLEPSLVYLHAGTRDGARAIGIRGVRVVEVNTLPQELQVLAPHEVENFLCIFKPRVAG